MCLEDFEMNEWRAARKEDIRGVIRNEYTEDTDLLCWGTQAKEISQGTCLHIKCSLFQSLNRAHCLSFPLSEKLHRNLGKEFNIPPCLPRSLIRGMQYNLLFYYGRQFWIILQNQRAHSQKTVVTWTGVDWHCTTQVQKKRLHLAHTQRDHNRKGVRMSSHLQDVVCRP